MISGLTISKNLTSMVTNFSPGALGDHEIYGGPLTIKRLPSYSGSKIGFVGWRDGVIL